MAPPRIVQAFDVVEDIGARVISGATQFAGGPFDVQRWEETSIADLAIVLWLATAPEPRPQGVGAHQPQGLAQAAGPSLF